MAKPLTFRQLADLAKQRQRLRWQQMSKPTDEWRPELFLSGGQDECWRLPIPTRWFANVGTKERLVHELIVPAIRMGGVRMLALQVVMYGLSAGHPVMEVIAERVAAGDSRPTRGLPRFQEIEGSEEQLWVNVFDAERHEAWQARIERPRRGRPQLGPFKLMEIDSLEGLMIDPIKEALR